MSSADVEKTAQIIIDLVDNPDLVLTDTTLENLAKAVDNINTETEVGELRKEEASSELRKSAVKVVGKIAAKSPENGALKSLETVGGYFSTNNNLQLQLTSAREAKSSLNHC